MPERGGWCDGGRESGEGALHALVIWASGFFFFYLAYQAIGGSPWAGVGTAGGSWGFAFLL